MTKKILLVEDEVIIAMAETNQLQSYGYSVSNAYTGNEACELVKKERYDLILMDIDLGNGLSGPEAAEKILMNNDIPIVFLSSHMEKEVVEKTEKITSYGYIVKNSGIIVLDASIKMALKLFKLWNEKNESEERYRFLVENIKDVIWIYDITESAFIFISPSVNDLRGYTPKEIMSMPLENALNDLDSIKISILLEKRIKSINDTGELDSNRTFYTENIEQPCKDGTKVLTEVITRFYRNSKNGHIEVHGVTRDISDRN